MNGTSTGTHGGTPIVLRQLSAGMVRDAARAHFAAGLSPLRLGPRDHRPLDTDWTTHSPVQSEQNVDLHFADDDSSIGLILGTPSNGLIDVDLDWPASSHALTTLGRSARGNRTVEPTEIGA